MRNRGATDKKKKQDRNKERLQGNLTGLKKDNSMSK